MAGVGFVVVGEDFAEDAKGFLDGSFAIEGADVGGAVVLGGASETDIGDFGFEVDADIGDGFIVAEQDIPLWHIALDHLGFEEEGVHLGVNNDPVGVGDFLDEGGGFGVFGGVVEILADAVFEDGGFANVDDLAGSVLMEIDPWGSGESFELGGQGGAEIIGHIIYIIA